MSVQQFPNKDIRKVGIVHSEVEIKDLGSVVQFVLSKHYQSKKISKCMNFFKPLNSYVHLFQFYKESYFQRLIHYNFFFLSVFSQIYFTFKFKYRN